MAQGRWVRKPTNGLNVIFIHGINSSEECWKHKNGSYWPDLLEQTDDLADVGIYLFTYRTGINTGFYSLSDIVDSLREYFELDDLISSTGIIFVCHSMGGIVARRFLVNQQSTLIQKQLNKIGLFLLASPSLGSDYANMLSSISRIMGHTQASALRFSQNNVWLIDLDKDFKNLLDIFPLKIKGKELIEDLPLFGKRLLTKCFKKQIVEPFSGAVYFGKSFKVPGSDHITIATPADKNAVQHRLLVQFIKEFIDGILDIESHYKKSINLSRSIGAKDILIEGLSQLIKIDSSTESLKSFLYQNKRIFLSKDEIYLGVHSEKPEIIENFEIQYFKADLAKFLPVSQVSNMPGKAVFYAFLSPSETLDSENYLHILDSLTKLIDIAQSNPSLLSSTLEERDDYRTAISKFRISGIIYIGRRENMRKEELNYLQTRNTKNSLQVLTYDSLIESLESQKSDSS